MADPPDIDKKQSLTSEATLDRWLPDDVSDDQFSETPFITNTGTSLPLDLELRLSCRPLIDLSSTGSNSFCETVITDFVVGKERGSTVKDLGPLLHLNGTLRISKLQNVVSPKDAANARLVEKTQLDELVLEWGDDNVDPEHDRDVLEQLVPHTNLKKLSISFYCGTKFPHWLGDYSFSNMVFLRLSQCKNCLDLPPLGTLPSLKFLIIEWMDAVKRVGPEFCGKYKPFQSLETLTFEGMLEWEEWDLFDIGKGEFPCLRELSIRRCPKLIQNLPISLPSIVKVEISESPKLVTTVIAAASSYKGPLHYHDKIRFISDDKVASFSEPEKVDFFFMTKDDESSSLPIIEGMMQSATELPLQGITNSSFPMTVGGVGSSFPMTEDVAAEFSLHMTQTPNIRNEADFPTNNWSNQDARQDLSSFKSKKVSGISELMEVTGLHSLKIDGCDALEFIPEEVMDSNTSLQHLYIINCCSLKSFPEGHPPTALKVLYIQNCKKLEFLPHVEKMHHYALLERLCLGSSCDSLEILPLDIFPMLRSLSIWDCPNLESLTMPKGIPKNLTSLEALEIRDCPKLVSFPKGGLPTPNLTSIWFSNCKNLKELPDQLHNLNCLRSMFINNCPELVSLPEGGLPSKLSLLSITFCDKLMLSREWGLHKLDCLRRLEIEGGCKNVESFPEDKLLPCILSSLRISGLSNLKYLNSKGLQHLTALKTLEISCCNKLQSLPEEGLPSSLSFLCIKECSLLKPTLQNKRRRLV